MPRNTLLRRLVATSIAVAAIALSLPIAAGAAPDSWEPDNDFATAWPHVVTSSWYMHTIDPSGDVDFVSYNVLANHSYQFWADPQTDYAPDTVITLYDQAYGFLDVNDDGGPGGGSIINYTPSTSQKLYLKIEATAGSTGTYHVRATRVAQVAGTVRDADTSNGIPDLDVTAYRYNSGTGDFDPVEYTMTDAQGRYWFYGLGTGVYRFGYTHYLYGPKYYQNAGDIGPAVDVATTAGTTVTLNDVSLEAVPSLVGMVTDEKTGAPLQNIHVRLYYNDPAVNDEWAMQDVVFTDSAGRYELPGRYGDYRIRFIDNLLGRYSPEWYDGGSSLADPKTRTLKLTYGVTATANAKLATTYRLAGLDRYTTAADIARAGIWAMGDVHDIVIASGEDRAAADPLAAAGLCWLYDAPLLLVKAKSTPDATKTLVKQIAAASGSVKLHVVGGSTSVPDARIAEIKAAAGSGVTSERVLAGGGRYDLASAIALRMKAEAAAQGKTPVFAAFIANGADPDKFFDALALSAASASKGIPILLVKEDSVPGATSSALKSVAPATVVIGGGPATVGSGVEKSLKASYSVERWSGPTRYDTAIDIANKSIARGWLSSACCGLAAKLPDALTGGVLIGSQNGVLLPTNGTTLTPAVKSWLSANKASILWCWVYGGTASVTDGVRTAAGGVLK